MADLSQLQLNGTTYNLKDATARDLLNKKIIVLDIDEFSELPKQISNSLITSNHVLLRSELGSPLVQRDAWIITTENGSLTISGTITGPTTMRLILGTMQNS